MTFIEEAVISGFTGKIVSDCIDVSWSKIKEADKNRKSKNQNLQTRIYQVIVDAINEATYNKYKGQDALYDAAEDLLNGLKSGNDNRVEVVKHGLSTLISDMDNDKGVGFIGILRTEISKECNFDLYKEILIMLLEQATEYSHSELQQIKELLNYIIQKLDENAKFQEDNTHNKVKSRTQEYADKWNSNMFLNDFDKRDKHAGVNVKLKDVYLESHLPHYVWQDNPEDEPSTDLKVLLSEHIEEKSGNKMLLILGQPGIGKSTLITWITANFTSRVDDIMVYQFAADLKDIDWQKSNISDEILEKLGLSYDDLNGTTLILDGLDEISVSDRKEILDKIYWELIKGRIVERFSLIITCRENYINSFERIQCKYITLLPWGERQIKDFCTTFQDKTKCDISEHTLTRVIENKDIFGIPLILYMILALNISIEKEGSVVDIYDKIFSLDGGIYDRCIENKNFAENHKIVGEIKKQIHQISREIAIWMFENNPNEVFIPQKEYEKVCDNVIKAQAKEDEFIKQDFLIGNFFKLRHCEGVGTEEICFVHRSIYEYFVAETIYSVIKNDLFELSEESKKELAGNIAVYLKQGRITDTIGEYLQHKILKLYYKLDSQKKERFYQWWEEAIDMMIAYGMFYFTGNTMQNYVNMIIKEANCFVNIVKILRLLLKISKRKFIMQSVSVKQLEMYIRLSLLDYEGRLSSGAEKLDLRIMCLIGIDLSGVDLRRTNLVGTNLREANLVGANLERADLRESDLKGARLVGANLMGANLRRAHLKNVKLESSRWLDSDIRKALLQLREADFDCLIIMSSNGSKVIRRIELFPDEKISSNEQTITE